MSWGVLPRRGASTAATRRPTGSSAGVARDADVLGRAALVYVVVTAPDELHRWHR
jgi:hypothetical protein